MKLYIPTSSLNLNNILSSESISPASFYRCRGFGYSSIYKIDLNPFENSILLYENCPKFEIAKSDLENHAMVIEVETDDCGCDLSSHLKPTPNEGVYQLGKTIYLNPYSTKIYFFSVQHYRTALSLTEQSGETKLAKLYSGTFEVRRAGDKEYQIDKCVDLAEMDLSSVCFDQRLNRIKGFAYAYTIAANRSVPKYIIKAKHIINEVSNLAYAIVNSPSGRGTQMQIDQLRYLLEEFTQLTNSPFYSAMKQIVDEAKLSEIDALMKQYGVSFRFSHSYNHLFPQLTSSINEGYNPIENALNEMRQWVTVEEATIKADAFLLDGIGLTPSKITQFEDKTVGKEETRTYYQNLINDIFSSMEIYESTLNMEKMSLADSITRTVKGYIGDAWDESPTKKYLNNLRRNIAGQEEFSLQWNKGLISAIAAFLLKGDSHDKLTRFLTDCEIEDGRLAFGFYGCACGFANMSRVFTDELLNNEDSAYLSKIYKEIYRQLFRIELAGDLLIVQPRFTTGLTEQVYDVLEGLPLSADSQRKIQDALDCESRRQDPQALWFIINTLLPRSSKARDAIEDLLCNNENNYASKAELESAIWRRLRQLPAKSITKGFKEKLQQAIDLEDKQGDPQAFLCILDDMMSTSSKEYKTLKKRFCPEAKKKTSRIIEKVTDAVDGVLDFFSPHQGGHDVNSASKPKACIGQSLLCGLIVDTDIELLIRRMRSECEVSNPKIIENFEYIHKTHQSYERGNKDTIRHFRNLCFPKDHTKVGKIDETPTNKREVDAIVEWLQHNFRDSNVR